MIIMDGQALAEKILKKLKLEIAKHRLKPGLALIMVGNNPASEIYVAKKEKACDFVGIRSIVKKFSSSISEKHLLDEIEKLNFDEQIDGIILQLPLPYQLHSTKLTSAIAPEKDVDGLHPLNIGKMALEDPSALIPATPKGIMTLLKEYSIPIEGRSVVIIGRSNIVGKPLALLMSRKAHSGNASVTLLHSKSQNIPFFTQHADIVIAAVNIPHFLKVDMVKQNVVVIDVGIHHLEDKIIGDVDYESMKSVASFITPVPKGVGPMTVASLIENTYQSFFTKQIHA